VEGREGTLFIFGVSYHSLFFVYLALVIFVLCNSFMWPHKFSVSNAAAAGEKVLPVGNSLQETLLAPSTDGELPQPPVDSDAMLQLRRRGPRNVELHRFGWKQQAISVEFITLVAIISVQSLASKISSATTRYLRKNSQVMPRNCP
jgi:hypothetical protein